VSAIWVEIIDTRGSTPRDVGTAMRVTLDGIEGTIGGGALEHAAIAEARDLIASDGCEKQQTYPLGPDLGQCCGGAVTLQFTRDARLTDQAIPVNLVSHVEQRKTLWLWGAGHVGRAVVDTLNPQAFSITWIDEAQARFPDQVAAHVAAMPAADMPLLAKRAPSSSHHLIFTYSHHIDLELCAALLRRGVASIGLIGSDTKRARFFKRLREMGLDPTSILCPIGDKSLGKAPHQIARGVALQFAEKGAIA